MRPMPRTWPSIRASPLRSADLFALPGAGARTTRAAPGLRRDVIACAADRVPKRLGGDPRGIVGDGRLAGMQRDVHVRHTRKRFEHSLDARNTSAAAHAFNVEA